MLAFDSNESSASVPAGLVPRFSRSNGEYGVSSRNGIDDTAGSSSDRTTYAKPILCAGLA